MGLSSTNVRDNTFLQVLSYSLSLFSGHAAGMLILLGIKLPDNLALLVSSLSGFFFTTTVLYLSVEVR